MINTKNLKENNVYKVQFENWETRLVKFVNWQFQDISNYDVYGSSVVLVEELSTDIFQLIKDLDEFINFMEENKNWTLLKQQNENINILRKEFIENLNDVFDKRKMRVWVSIMYYKWISDRLDRTVSFEYFINKKTMEWELQYKYTFLSFRRNDEIHKFNNFNEFKKFYLEHYNK